MTTFLERNSVTFDEANELETYLPKMLKKHLKDKEIILTGEYHGVSSNSLLELEFLKYFSDKLHLKYYLQELPYSYSCRLNDYLKSGDEEILDEAFNYMKGSNGYSKEFHNKWIEVYKLNQDLSEENKIEIIGVDVEGDIYHALDYMCLLTTANVTSEKITAQIKALHDINDKLNKGELKDKQDELVKSFCTELKQSIVNNRIDYINYLDKDLFALEMINDNILNSMDCRYRKKGDIEKVNLRDSYMYKNFIKLYDTKEKGKYFGQFGMNHVFQEKQLDINWFGSLLKDSTEFQDKVISIVYFYKDCFTLGYKGESIELQDTYGNEYLEQLATKEFTFLNLIGKRSPFNNNLIWYMDTTDSPSEGETTDYYQYILIQKNQPASTMYE